MATDDPARRDRPEQLADWRAREPALQVIDVREPYEREAGRLADSRHIALVELTAQAATVERERPVVFYCRVGSRSDMAAQAFRAAGYEAYSLRGGLRRWADEGRRWSRRTDTLPSTDTDHRRAHRSRAPRSAAAAMTSALRGDAQRWRHHAEYPT